MEKKLYKWKEKLSQIFSSLLSKIITNEYGITYKTFELAKSVGYGLKMFILRLHSNKESRNLFTFAETIDV